MADDPSSADRWMSYSAVGDVLGITPGAAKALSRRRGWEKRPSPNSPSIVQVRVPSDVPAGGAAKSGRKRPPQRDVSVDVSQALAALQGALERSDGDRRILQQQSDTLWERLAAIQVDLATVAGQAATERAIREAAEKRSHDLQQVVAELRQAASRPWWKRW